MTYAQMTREQIRTVRDQAVALFRESPNFVEMQSGTKAMLAKYGPEVRNTAAYRNGQRALKNFTGATKALKEAGR